MKLFRYFIFSLLISCSAPQNLPGPSPQHAAPEFTLQYLNGSLTKLSDHRGKLVLLHFWASWCQTCVYELATLKNLQSYLKDQDFEILAIAIDDKWPAIRKIQDQQHLPFPLLLDETGKTRSAYKVSGLPQSFLISKNGEYLEFIEPVSGNLVKRTNGVQTWDQPATIEYLKNLSAK